MRAIRPLSAPNRSASMDTLLALGKAATSTTTYQAKRFRGKPAASTAAPTARASTGCTNSFIAATGTTSDQRAAGPWPLDGCSWDRASTAPMVNNATGEAESPNRPTVRSTGPGKCHANLDASAPDRMAQGMGLAATPLSALRAAWAAEVSDSPPGAESRRESAIHSELVMTMSTIIVTMAGPAAWAPSSATSSGTPMKPVLGNAATKAPKAASFQPMRPRRVTSTASATITIAQNK